jgi:hypothetical protein
VTRSLQPPPRMRNVKQWERVPRNKNPACAFGVLEGGQRRERRLYPQSGENDR